jgi:penicillin amidase
VRVPSLLKLGAIAAAGLVPLGLAVALVARAPIPLRQGTESLPGLSGRAVVRFDARAVPHVRAATELDAYRVLGFLHAGNRLVQMELRRRAAAGRLSEIFGSAALAFDEGARRRAGMGGGVERELSRSSPRLVAALEAYSQGVNAYLASHARPWELVALGVRPEPWTPLDCLRTGRIVASSVTDSEDLEDFRFRTAARIGVGPLVRFLDAASEEPGGGSNAWAVAGSRTASGRPLLASDPHLPPEMPGVWYAAHLTSRDGLDVAGLTLAGTPGVVIGHNGAVAWGLTMTQADDADLFLEDLAASGSLVSRKETIRVKGGADVEIVVDSTVRGPIVRTVSDREAFSLSWAAAARPGSSEAFLAAAHARDPRELAEAWRLYGGPPVNVCWASASGHIGVFVAGAIPRRPRGDGRLPARGPGGEDDWQGLVPPEELPSIQDPPEGFVATANDDWSAAGRPLPFPGDYAGRERIARIRSVLAEASGATVDDMRALQGDVLSLHALRVKRALSALAIPAGDAARARGILLEWDGRCTRRGAVRLYEAFLVDLRRRTFAAREERDDVRLPAGFELVARMLEGSAGLDLWDDPGTAEVETREAIVAGSLGAALAEVEQEDGKVVAAWSWGRAHALTYRHLFSNTSRTLGRFLDVGPVELPGDGHTVSVAAYSLREGTYRVGHIPSARLLVDLGDPDRSRLVLPLGQSEHLADPNADDQLDAWSRVRDYPLPFRPAAVDAASVATLRLDP